MGDFRSFLTSKRGFAQPMQPVVDPAGWLPDDLRDVAAWSYRISERDIEELAAAIAVVRRNRVPLVEVARENFPLAGFAEILADVRRELMDGRGIVMLRGFPVERFDREEAAIAYLGLGGYLGKTMSQNKQGHILGHVKDLGGDYADPHTRGYMTSAEMRFHTDACDYVGLLCLRTSRSGGESRIASSVTVYNRILERRPDLAKALTEDFYRSRSGETNAGDAAFFKQPIFSFAEGYFSATGAGVVSSGEECMLFRGDAPFRPGDAEASSQIARSNAIAIAHHLPAGGSSALSTPRHPSTLPMSCRRA